MQSLRELLSEVDADGPAVSWRDGSAGDGDVSVSVLGTDEKYRLHRRFLIEGARSSSFFQQRLGGPAMQEGTAEVELDTESVPVMCRSSLPTVWDFLYTGAVRGNVDSIVPLLVLGQTLGIKDLRNRTYLIVRKLLEKESTKIDTPILLLEQALSVSPALDNVEKAAVICIATKADSLKQEHIARLSPKVVARVLSSEALRMNPRTLSSAIAATMTLVDASKEHSVVAAAVAGDGDDDAASGAGDGDAENPPNLLSPVEFGQLTRQLTMILPEDSLLILRHALEFDSGEPLLSLCLVRDLRAQPREMHTDTRDCTQTSAARGFVHCQFSDLFRLPPHIVRQILVRDDLRVDSETTVFRVITAYLTRATSVIGEELDDEAETLWIACRFPYLPMPTLLHATACEGIPSRLVMEGITASMMMQRGPRSLAELDSYVEAGSHPAAGGVSRLVPRDSYKLQSLLEASIAVHQSSGKRQADIETLGESVKTLHGWVLAACSSLARTALDSLDPKFGPSGAVPVYDETRRYVLVYRASRDGWSPGDFHRRCDGIGPTLTIVATVSGHVFGGFATTSWNSNGGFVNAPGSFLFTLRDAAGLGITRMDTRPMHGRNTLRCDPDSGPTFGEGPDLRISGGADGADAPSSANLDVTFAAPRGLPPGFSKETFLTGAKEFWPCETEVFKLCF